MVRSFGVAFAVLVLFGSAFPQNDAKEEVVSFKSHVFPVIERYCLPCHAEANFNPSELAMDNYEMLSTGGQSGSPIVAGKSSESLIVRKLGEKPPEGERMPLNSKKKIREGKAVWLTDEELKMIAAWIDQGAKNN